MKIWYNNVLESETRQLYEVNGSCIRIGRDPENDLVLNSPFVPPEAAVLYRRSRTTTDWELVAVGIDSVHINDDALAGGQGLTIDNELTVRIFPFTLTFNVPNRRVSNEHEILAELDQQMGEFIKSVHLELLERMDLDARPDERSQNAAYIQTVERNLEEIAKLKGLLQSGLQKLLNHLAGHCVRSSILKQLVDRSRRAASGIWDENHQWTRLSTAVPDREIELDKTAAFVHQKLGLEQLPDVTDQTSTVEGQFWPLWKALLPNLHEEFKQYLALRHLKIEVKDTVFGYGPLEDLLRSPIVSEIMVVDRNHIYVERGGVVENSGRRFFSDEVTQAIIERIVSKVGRRIDRSKPLVDARLTDGSRVNAVIPPLAVNGPCITIRKFPARKLLIEDLIAKGSLTGTVAEFLRAAVLKRCNILISGGTGTGKTTLLNCLSDFIPDKERIVTVEDTAELQLKKEHVVRLETKQANVEGAGAYEIRDLVKNALRMRPDRIVVGECRGAEALDMLQAMNTGHDGSLTTVHANSSEDVILRLEVLVQMAADLPTSSIQRQIASAIDLIVQLTRMRDGSRRVTQVTEVEGIDESSGAIRMRDLFTMTEFDGKPSLTPTGRLPTFMDELIEQNLIRLESFYL